MKNVMKRFLAVLLVIVLIGGNLSTAALADDWDWSYEGFSEDDWYDDGWSESYDYYTSSAQEQANTTYDYPEYNYETDEAAPEASFDWDGFDKDEFDWSKIFLGEDGYWYTEDGEKLFSDEELSDWLDGMEPSEDTGLKDADDIRSILEAEYEDEDEIATANLSAPVNVTIWVTLEGADAKVDDAGGLGSSISMQIYGPYPISEDTVNVMSLIPQTYYDQYESNPNGYYYSTRSVSTDTGYFGDGLKEYNPGESGTAVLHLEEGKDATVSIHRFSLKRDGVKTFTLHFDMNGVAADPIADIETVIKLANGADHYTFTNLPQPTGYSGCNFKYWSVDGSTEVTSVDCAPGETVTVKAMWEEHRIDNLDITAADNSKIVFDASNFSNNTRELTATITGVAGTHYSLTDSTTGTEYANDTLAGTSATVTFSVTFDKSDMPQSGAVVVKEFSAKNVNNTKNDKRAVAAFDILTAPASLKVGGADIFMECITPECVHDDVDKVSRTAIDDYIATHGVITYDPATGYHTTATVDAEKYFDSYNVENASINDGTHYLLAPTTVDVPLVSVDGSAWSVDGEFSHTFQVVGVLRPQVSYQLPDGTVLLSEEITDNYLVKSAAEANLTLAADEKLSYWTDGTTNYKPGELLPRPAANGARVVLTPKIDKIVLDDYKASVEMVNWTYGDTPNNESFSKPQGPSDSHYADKPEITYSDANGAALAEKPKNAGSYTVTAVWAPDNADLGLPTVERTCDFVIYRRNISISSAAVTYTYDGTAHYTADAIVTGMAGGESIDVAPYSKTHHDGTIPTYFQIAWTNADKNNYNVVSNTVGNITIEQRPITFESRSVEMWWDGSELNNATKMNAYDKDYAMEGDAEATGVTISGQGLAEGDTVKFTFHPGRSLLGISNNDFDYEFGGSAHASDYYVTKNLGTLTVSLFNQGTNPGGTGGNPGGGTEQPGVTPEPGTEPSTPPSIENSPEPSEQPSVTPEPGTEPSTPPSTENTPEPGTEPDEPDEPDVPVEPTVRPVVPTPPQNGGDVALPSDADFGNDYDPNSPELEEPAAPAEPVTPAEPETPEAPEAPVVPAAPETPEDTTPAAPEGPTEINPDDTPLDDVPQIPGADDNAPSATPRPAATPAPTASPAPAAPVDDESDDNGDGAEPEVTIDEDDTPLADLPEVDGEVAEPELTIDEEVIIDEDETPLANFTDCCALHFVLMLLALAVAVYYTYDRKKRQAREFEVRSEL